MGSVPGSISHPRSGNIRVWGDLHMASSKRWPGHAQTHLLRDGQRKCTAAQTETENTKLWPNHRVEVAS